jgi:hypothetical protein
MFFSPVLEDSFEVGAYFIGLFEDLFGLLIEIKLDAVADDH